jgi:uncharacterized membrane protein
MAESYRRKKLPEWGIPLCYAVSAVIAGIALPRIESRLLPGAISAIDPSVAIAIYSSIASGMIAFTGIVFALTFLMVQFSANAYSPRLVLWIARDRVLSHAIGVFTSTFLYAIAAMAWVNRTGVQPGMVPLYSLWLVIVMLLASVCFFLALIERLSRLQVNRMLAFTSAHGRRVIEKMYPPLQAPMAIADPDELRGVPVTQILLYTGRPQVIQALDAQKLMNLAIASGGIIEVVASVGDTPVEGRLLLRIRGGWKPTDERTLRNTFEMGLERTFDQDPKYAIRLLVDIAMRALSPGINDPTTAVQSLDYIEDLLLRLGRRRLEIGAFRDAEGHLRLLVPNPSWDDLLSLAFDEVCACGRTSVQVMRRLRALTSDLMEALPEERREALRHYQQRLAAIIARSFEDAEAQEQASIEDRQGLGAAHRI